MMSLRMVRAVLTRPPAWQRQFSLERSFTAATSFPRTTKNGRSSPSPGRQRAADFVASLPVRKSSERKEQPTVSVVCSHMMDDGGGLDDRSNAKMVALSKAKEKMRTLSNDDVTPNDEKRIQTGRELAHAYSQAIKYTSRQTKSVAATRVAEEMLYEWMDEVMRPFGVTTSGRLAKINDDVVDDDVSNTAMYLTKKWTIRTANEIARRLGGENTTSPNVISVLIPPPSSSDYINLLRAYSSSKARRKGQQCEVLIKNMITLADVLSCHCYITVDDETVGEAIEVRWVKESIPNSKAFALAIKCHAGSTRPDSFERIILLNHIHDAFADCCTPHVAGICKDDPYVLFHSIKALKNLQKKKEYNLGKEWLGRLHKFVTTAENDEYFGQVDMEKGETEDSDQSFTTIDVTPAYNTMIRLMARMRGKIGVAEDARRMVLDRMHEIKAYDSDVNILRKRIATIDIRANSYNLILGLYKDSKNAEDTTKAINLLEQMVDAGRKTLEDRGGVPLPTEVSFEYTIMAIANLADSEKALDEAERLIKLMEEQEYIESSVAAYNAYIIVTHRQLYGKPQLYDTALDILDKMNRMGMKNPIMLPSSDTLALVMKSCALSEHSDHKRVLATATTLFLQMKEKETLSDRAYYYMMKCVDMYSNKDSEAKKEHIQELFSDACQRGLCSANVLSCFRSCVSDEDYRLTVGHGRLADHWIANITSPRALYTDGSKGGVGKNARRKGKSTSDWVKKTKAKDNERETRKSDKRAKKSFKKIINSTR